ncbi:MAG: rRNA pseudouridine synthase [Eggerthellaceae bacterium]|nr:rRNA pseudouridine synthase [Eggerthellaceae bacterium]
MRLQRFLARAGMASRRGSEDLMTAGRVTVNGEVVRELGSKVDPLTDEVAVDGRPVAYPSAPVTLMLNKPAGYITTMSDPYGRPCVASLVPTGDYPGLFPVGRLDTDTTGLLLFTTDGDLAHRLLHPRHHVQKSYEAWVEGVPRACDLDRLARGIDLEDGPTQPAEVELLGVDKGTGRLSSFDTLENKYVYQKMTNAPSPCQLPSLCQLHAQVRITIREGRKRQVRRMFEAIGHPVASLHRPAFGGLALGTLEEGSWRLLTEAERTLLP